MEQLMRLNSSSNGKEKLLRFHWAILSKRNGDKEVVYNLKRLEALLATVRRFLRFGRGVDLLYSSPSQVMTINNDSFHGFITSLARVSSTLYLLTDHLVLLRKVGLVKADERKWLDTSNRFLLLASFLFFIKNINEIREILQIYTHSKSSRSKNLTPQEILKEFLLRHRAISLDAVKNLCDTLVALDNVGEYRLSPVKLSLVGSLSSIVGIIQMTNPAFRVMQ